MAGFQDPNEFIYGDPNVQNMARLLQANTNLPNQGGYAGGLLNGLSQAVAAYGYHKAVQGAQARQKAMSDALINASVPNSVAVSPRPTDANNNNAGFDYNAGQDLTGNILRSGNSDLVAALAPSIVNSRLTAEAQAHQPITPYQQAGLDIERGNQTLAQQRAQQAQSNADRSFGLQQQQFNYNQSQNTPEALAAKTTAEKKAALPFEEELARVKADETLKQQMGDAQTIEQMAQGISNYKLAPLSGFAMAKPGGQAIMARVQQINPNYNAQNYTKSQQAYKDFGTGKKGDLTRSFNVAISHLNTLSGLSDALNNGDVQAVNQISNKFKEQFGSTAPTNFDAAKAIVGDEIIKAVIGSGGALGDRENAQNKLNSAKTLPQLKGVMQTYKDLMAGQLRGLKRQYEQSTMRDDFNSLLAPETQAELEAPQPAAPQATGQGGSGAPSLQDLYNEAKRRGLVK